MEVDSPGLFQHFMLKEIYEQPTAICRTIAHLTTGRDLFSGRLIRSLADAEKIVIAASGSSRNAGLAGEIMIEDLSGVPVDVEYASEYSYRSHRAADRVVVVITQSGETADTIAAQREALARGAETIAICNVATSTVAREATGALVTQAGPELAVPATKSFTTQLTVLYLLASYMGQQRGIIPSRIAQSRLDELRALAGLMARRIPKWDALARTFAERHRNARNVLFLGRSVHYAVAREAALKLKEISYTQAEGYPTGELKHGPYATVTETSPVAFIATRDESDHGSMLRYRKNKVMMQELRESGGILLAVASEADSEMLELSQDVFPIPGTSELLLPIVEVVPLQLFAYHVARLSGCDIDHPRNLVKAVVRE